MKETNNAKFGEWAQHESVEALQAFFESDDARRFREIFSQGSAQQELAVFQRDAERRCLSENEAANHWWSALSELVQSEPDRALALAEPLAQHGLLAEELYENLPQKFEPQALLKAIAFAAGAQNVFTSGISDTESWTDEKILERLGEVKTQLDGQRDSAEAVEWWQNFERDNQHRPGTVLRLAEELAVRKVSATEFHAAILQSGTENITANLHYLDYLRLKTTEDANQTRRLVSDDSGWWLKSAQGMTKVRGWADQRIRERYEKAKENLGWDEASETTGAAIFWWTEFENENVHRPALLLRLAEELARRNSTIQSFHEAFELSAANDIQANLFFLDYMRLKKEEEQKKKAEEEQRQREEAREQRRKELIAKASHLFRELLPLFEAEIPAPALAEEGAAILLNLPRRDVPDAVRQRFDQAIGSFGFETVLLNKSGKIKQRRQCQAFRLVEELAPGVPLEMVEIPGGSFLMGTNPDNAGKEKEEIARYTEKENAERWANTEMPQHEVTVLPFHIGKFAVTQEQWSVVAGWEKVERDLNPDPARFKGDDRPVEQVSWHDAVEFCARLSKKLAACIGCQPKRNGNMPAEPEPPRHSLSAKPSRRRL